MPVAVEDQALYAVVSGAKPATVTDVIARMQSIDAMLGDDDGLKWFNRLYLRVTQAVDLQPATAWKDAEWLLALDVVFAGLYFDAVAAYLAGSSSVPGSWQAVMEARHRQGIDRIQFALAGMNAHINHDLTFALLKTNAQRGVTPAVGSPQYADYEAVNQLLQQLMPEELQMLATDALGVLAQDTGKAGRLLAFWNICAARDLAWQFADSLRTLPDVAHLAATTTQDQMTGVVGRAILAFA